jgi:hypothetical protein
MMKILLFMIGVALVVLCTAEAVSQEQRSGEVGIVVDVAGTPLDIQSAQDLSVIGLNAGTSVVLVPDGADAFIDGSNTPNPVYTNIVSNSVAGAVDVTGQENGNVILSFALPFALYGDGSFNGVVHVDYNGTSACWVDDGGTNHYFNPKVPEGIILSATTGTSTHVNLGGIFTVDPGSSAGVYTGTAIVTVAYAAN